VNTIIDTRLFNQNKVATTTHPVYTGTIGHDCDAARRLPIGALNQPAAAMQQADSAGG
jgi:hypothetical protein